MWRPFQLIDPAEVDNRLLMPRRAGEITVVSPDPEWPAAFERVRTIIVGALGPSALAVEHVGSTAVPGLWAKPIIDVELIVANSGADLRPPTPSITMTRSRVRSDSARLRPTQTALHGPWSQLIQKHPKVVWRRRRGRLKQMADKNFAPSPRQGRVGLRLKLGDRGVNCADSGRGDLVQMVVQDCEQALGVVLVRAHGGMHCQPV